MKLYLIEQHEVTGWDVYDSAVVAADSAEIAKRTHPSGNDSHWDSNFPTWCTNINDVVVTYLGDASPEIEAGVVLASFNAG